MTNTKQLPLPRRAPTFILPKRKCRNCGRLLGDSKYPCCSYGCSQEYAAMLARIEAADKEPQGDYPF